MFTRKALLLLSGLLLMALFSVLAANADIRQSATMVAVESQQTVQAPVSRAACMMARHDGVLMYYATNCQTGIGFYTYFNPTLMCATPTYPFEITSFSFTLFDPGGYVWPAQMDVVVYAVTQQPDSCTGPGVELCRYPIVADAATYGYPNVGTYTFPSACCVNSSFFVGVEYRAGTAGSTPSVMFDNNVTPVICDNWARWTDGMYYEWYNYWAPPVAGYPLFWVDGETESANCATCDWQPGDPYKMHFPQLPNDAGWDVNATAPTVLADDWQCSETGLIKEIHFWGSWRNGIEGRILYFVLSVHADIPADPPQFPYSRPGETLWEREVTEFTETPIDPPSLEGWYDPSINEIIPSDHGAYFQYDICFDNENDWIKQAQGVVYWLNISAVIEDPQTTRWGWKSTLDHFNDDAVWAYWGALDWMDMWEPSEPIHNQFYAQIDPQGVIFAGGGTDYYGDGWYWYESGWWNIWFYDHPFTYDRGKAIRMDLVLGKMNDMLPSFVILAINWSTDRWSLMPQQDSIPPLPGVDEELFIRRDTVLLGEEITGHFVFDDLIRDYNPEWVSVDVIGSNLFLEGIITHECRASLDLSFVITSEPSACDCMPGDANGSTTLNISDAVYLIAYIFSGGLPPTPYPVCSGDANCDCTVNISDAVYLIAYIFASGTAPCSCQQWLSQCGPPLRK